MKKWIFLFVSFLIWQSSLAVSITPIDLTPSATPNFFEAPSSNPHQTHINLIQKAQKSIFIEMFHMTDLSVTDALIAARDRGVDVHIILDGTQLRSSTSVAVTQKLTDQKMNWVKSSPAFSITHTKAMIIDDDTAMISTMNLTMAGSQWRDWGVLTSDRTVLQEMKAVFEQDVTNAQTGGKDTPVLKYKDLLWSPVNAKSKLLELIQSAQKTIEVTVENFTHDEIAQALIVAAARGVKIRVLTPEAPAGTPSDFNKKTSLKLIDGGVLARQMPGPITEKTPYLHGKDMIIDHQRAYLGSINFSKNSLENARELGIIIEEPAQVSRLLSDFEADWSAALAPKSLP